jgi:hypothetical protein
MTAGPGLEEELRADAQAGGGMSLRGAFHPLPGEVPALPDGSRVATLVLLGLAGAAGWAAFAASDERRDGLPEPLDRWSRRTIDSLAGRHGAMAWYPFDGPPWLPFLRWARQAEPMHASPLGLLIHPRWGLWHSYRGALALRERVALAPQPSPGSQSL